MAIRPLWQILLKAKSKASTAALTCDECFWLLEYLTEAAAAGGPALDEADAKELARIARTHLNACPHCREHHLAELRRLEAFLRRSQRP
ncbi:MAG: hypothetical protein ACE5G8_06410 [Anaerolineae bacterium]